ncbi:hypothetical protein NUW58_g2458 [Xylaria curta]|uniref:Uncharacterized protein n=1 Tax=Xylaria curta TaxID=42375 RepID=A0ACC1PIA4_9PEZI|nr:hypothetical protein NUW58_g2458 [Xylaria curta]
MESTNTAIAVASHAEKGPPAIPHIASDSSLPSSSDSTLPAKVDAITDWDGPDDPANPKNWSLGLRIYHTTLPALYGFSVSLGTSIFSAGVFDVMKEFHTQGRKAVYIITLPIFLLFTAGAGLSKNIESFIILRFLSATFGSPALAVGAGTVADIWDLEHGGGLATVLITSTFFLGPSLGPLIGGYTIQTRGDWRWLMWVLLLIAGPIGLIALPSRETSKKIILARRAKQRGLPGPPKPPAAALKMLLVITLGRPLKMLVSEPIVIAWALYHSFVFGVLFAFFESYPYVFTRVYGFSLGQVGLAFLGIFIGTLFAVVTFGIIDKTVYQRKKVACAPAKPPPEERLYTSMLGAFGIPVALFWFGWTARSDIHFLSPIAAGIPFGWGVVTLFLGGITFLLDTYGATYGASAVAANGLLRYAFGAGFPLFTIQICNGLPKSQLRYTVRKPLVMALSPTKTLHDAAMAVKDHPVATLRSRVVRRTELPAWMQECQYIDRAYRKQQDSFRGCFQSLFYIHNETVNIWSHLIPGTFFVAMTLWAAFPALHGGYAFKRADLLALQTYLLGASICCLFSPRSDRPGSKAFYHCVSCHSEHVARRCLKLDYLGIASNITSTCISATYFGLYGQPWLANFYISLILACGLAAFWSMLDPSVDGPRAAKFRAAVFIALGASGFAPILHAALSPSLTLDGFSVEHVLAQSAFYLLGTAFYVNRIPEKYWRGTFDVWGASHQVFHILVSVAQIVHLLGLRKSLMRHYTPA